MSIVDQCEREIVRFHKVFADWLRGDIPDTDEAFEAFRGALSRDFVMVVPQGRLLRYPELIRAVRDVHGQRADTENYRIWIEDVEVQVDHEDAIMATYEEWEVAGSERQGRLSSALLVFDDSMPEGLQWRHLHETWLPQP
jgi:hypothetical protein